MYFYNENGKRVKYELGESIGGEQYGNVYRLPDSATECIKIYKKGQVVNNEILKLIRSLDLKNFYKIYELLYSKRGNLRAHLMKYYKSDDIDILTMPMEYTLYNLCNLWESFVKLADNYIYASDVHTGNVILGSDEMTIIDCDIYSRSELQTKEQLRVKNISALRYLFEQLYLEALDDYHLDIATYEIREKIQSIFELYSKSSLDRTCNKLMKCKYPIDYIRSSRS